MINVERPLMDDELDARIVGTALVAIERVTSD
jgi:hypothetical protein